MEARQATALERLTATLAVVVDAGTRLFTDVAREAARPFLPAMPVAPDATPWRGVGARWTPEPARPAWRASEPGRRGGSKRRARASALRPFHTPR